MKIKPTFWFLRSSTIYFFISLVRSTGTTKPLIFDPYKVHVFNSEPSSLVPLPTYPIGVACPASNENEKTFNADISFSHKALFVKSYQPYRSAQLETCETNLELSAVYHRKSQYNEIQFGYEVYKEYPLPTNSHESKYEDYGRVSELGFFKRLNNAVMQKISPTLNKNKMSFLWLEKISVRYNYHNWSIKEVRYEIFRNADQMKVEKCKDYNLAKEVYGKEDFDEYYSSPIKGMKETYVQYAVKKYNLLLPYNFQATPSSPVSCSNLTTVPIWHSEAKTLLINLEHFLIAIGQITKNPLKIYSGIHGELAATRILGDMNFKEEGTLYVDQKHNRIQIPRVIYKIVRYQAFDCESKKELCWFEVAIIIQNSPKIQKEHLLCPENKCSEWGWDKIQYTNTAKDGEKSQHIYCCKFDKELKQKLGYTDEIVAKDLNLKDFPENYEKSTQKYTYTDMQKAFEEKMDEVVSESIFFKDKN